LKHDASRSKSVSYVSMVKSVVKKWSTSIFEIVRELVLHPKRCKGSREVRSSIVVMMVSGLAVLTKLPTMQSKPALSLVHHSFTIHSSVSMVGQGSQLCCLALLCVHSDRRSFRYHSRNKSDLVISI
jgi:hypothetical protein